MRLDRNSFVAGRPVKEVRDGLRRLGHYSFAAKRIVDIYYPERREDRYKDRRPHRVDPTDALLAARLIEPDKEHPGNFRVSDKGIRLRCAKLLSPITRAKAETLMSALLQRIVAANADEKFCQRIHEARVYGSYITDAPILNDIDLNIDLVCKEPWPERWERWKRDNDWHPGEYRDRSPERQVQIFLKARCPYLHIDWTHWASRDKPPDWPSQRIWPKENS
jgi:hypothetical protein